MTVTVVFEAVHLVKLAKLWMCFQGVGRSKHSGRGAKVLSTKVTGRPDARRSASLPSSTPTLVPPMTSVVAVSYTHLTLPTNREV